MTSQSAYQEALDYIYSFVDFSLTRALRYTPEKFNLGRMQALLGYLGNPQLQYPVIHIAGTKGKGSVTALCANALKAAGYRTGCYTSPHLQDFRERIQVNGNLISPESLIELVSKVKNFIAKVPEITTFELTTAIAFLYFANLPVDIAVIEVGLGGRLDATNLVDPTVSVITSISYDHMAILGDTLAKIAEEKAGIIKFGKPLVISPQKDEARQVIERVAAERKAPIYQVGKDFLYEAITHNLDGQTIKLWKAGMADSSDHYSLPLLGLHQVENASTAYAALSVLRETGFTIADQAIKDGFANAIWPGRFELLSRQPFLVIDSAHNRDSALRLRQAVDDYFPNLPVCMIFGASEDKDISGMYAELLPRVQQLVTTQSNHPRAASASNLADLARSFNIPIANYPQVEQALDFAINHIQNNGVVLAAGSLFIAAAVRDVWPDIRAARIKETIHEK
jgi:dihydrofolate synthase / folylpolyglutamate synthase